MLIDKSLVHNNLTTTKIAERWSFSKTVCAEGIVRKYLVKFESMPVMNEWSPAEGWKGV